MPTKPPQLKRRTNHAKVRDYECSWVIETEAINQPRNKAETDARQRLVFLALSDAVRASRRRANVSASKMDEICELS